MLKSKPFCDIIGNLSEVDHTYYPPSTVVAVAPNTMDRWAWFYLCLTGFAADRDFRDSPTDKDKDTWNKSNLRKWMEDNGELRTIRGTKVYEHTLDSGKRFQMWRLRKGIALSGVVFPKEKGPN